MTDLLPHRDGQMDTYTQSSPITRDVRAYWYSPAAVARMIEEARKEERAACLEIIDNHPVIAFNSYPTTRGVLAELIDIRDKIRKRGEK